jgi:hypothetical protein
VGEKVMSNQKDGTLDKRKVIGFIDGLITSAVAWVHKENDRNTRGISQEAAKEVLLVLTAIQNDLLKGNFDS